MYVGINDNFILFSNAISLDIEEVTGPEFQFAGHFHLVARVLDDVVDPAPNILAVLGGLVGVEAQFVSGLDWEGLLGLVCSSGAGEGVT